LQVIFCQVVEVKPGHLVGFTECPGLKFGCFCSVLIPHGHGRTPLQTHTWRKQSANPLTNRFRSTGWSVERYWIVRRIFACKVPTIGSQIGSSRSFSSVCFASWT